MEQLEVKVKYTFFTRDYFSNSGDYDFSREHYVELLEYCFRNCGIFSLQFMFENDLTKKLRKWEIENPGFAFQNETRPLNRHYYCADHSTHDFLLNITSSIFDFYASPQHPYPEDIVFYRKDGSILLDSVAHEGECSIYPYSVEEAMPIIRHGHWLYMEGGNYFEEGIPIAPAKEHQLPPMMGWNLLKDPMFNTLTELYKVPENYINHPDIESLLSFIDEYLRNNSNPPELHLPKTAPPYVPTWWLAFRLYVLGKCEANTNDDIMVALHRAGFAGRDAFNHFFTILHLFAADYFNWLEANV